MDNPIDLAVVYLKIYFLGMPFNMLYNLPQVSLEELVTPKDHFII